MEFNVIIKDVFSEFLKQNGFSITMDEKNAVEYKSNRVSVSFIYNPFAFEYCYFIKLNADKREYQNSVVEQYLKIFEESVFYLKKQEEKIDLWANRKKSYFDKFKNELLLGDEAFFSELKKYSDDLNNNYNKSLKK